jgi:hypothetical protein
MSGFTKTVKREFQFDGDTVSVEFKRLTRADALSIAPLSAKMSTIDKDEEAAKVGSEWLEKACEMLPSYIVAFSGLRDGDGNVLGLEDALAAAYFMPLVRDLFNALLGSSMLTEADAKNSAGQPAAG